MADLVRVRLGRVEKNMGRALAEASGAQVLDEPTHNRDGSLRATTRAGGRRVKPKTSVAIEAAKKKAVAAEAAADDTTTPEEN